MLRDIPILTPIDRILNCFSSLIRQIFVGSADGYMRLLMDTIMSSPLLYLGAILLLCGFVIGILKRLITL